MGRWLFLLLLLGGFLYVFFRSDTLETNATKRMNEVNIEYSSTSYLLHWDRFFDYLKDLSRQVENEIGNLSRKYSHSS